VVKRLVKKVLLDSNFLFLPISRGINIVDEVENLLNSKVEFLVLKPVIDELEKIASKKRGLKLKKQAQFALKLSEKFSKLNFNNCSNVDDCLVKAAVKLKCLVATGDMELRKKLRKVGVPVIYPRKKIKKLVLEGYVD